MHWIVALDNGHTLRPSYIWQSTGTDVQLDQYPVLRKYARRGNVQLIFELNAPGVHKRSMLLRILVGLKKCDRALIWGSLCGHPDP